MAYQLLKPTRKQNPFDVIGTYKTDFTGYAGYLVKVSTNDPDNDTYWSTTKIGHSYDGVYNNLFVAPKTVTKAGATDVAGSILGLTIEGTFSTDNHGNLINGFNERWATENGGVPTGKPVQIVTQGIFEISTDIINGTPAPGSGIVPGAGGTYTVCDPANVVATATGTKLIGKCLSVASTRQSSAEIYIKL